MNRLAKTIVAFAEDGRPYDSPNPVHGLVALRDVCARISEESTNLAVLILRQADPEDMHIILSRIRGIAFSGLVACRTERRRRSESPLGGANSVRVARASPASRTLEDIL